jgi:hypothetical protein
MAGFLVVIFARNRYRMNKKVSESKPYLRDVGLIIMGSGVPGTLRLK